MYDVYVRAQAAPAGATYTDLYTVPGDTTVVVSGLSACNRSATATTIRVAVRAGGAQLDNRHFKYYDYPLGGNDTIDVLQGQVMDEGDVLTVYAASASVSFCVSLAEVNG